MCPYPVEEVVYLVSGLTLLLDRLVKILTISLQPLDLGLETLDSFRDLQHASDRGQGRLQAGQLLLKSLSVAAESVKYRLVEPKKVAHKILELLNRERIPVLSLLLRKLFRSLDKLLAQSYSLNYIVQDFSYIVRVIEHRFPHEDRVERMSEPALRNPSPTA